MIGGKLYLVEEFTGSLDILDLATGTWSSGPKRPFRACNAAATSLQAKLYLFGYCDDYPTDPETRDRGLVFDPGSNAWSEVTPAPITAAADASLQQAPTWYSSDGAARASRRRYRAGIRGRRHSA